MDRDRQRSVTSSRRASLAFAPPTGPSELAAGLVGDNEVIAQDVFAQKGGLLPVHVFANQFDQRDDPCGGRGSESSVVSLARGEMRATSLADETCGARSASQDHARGRVRCRSGAQRSLAPVELPSLDTHRRQATPELARGVTVSSPFMSM